MFQVISPLKRGEIKWDILRLSLRIASLHGSELLQGA
jgi:hypothetical protein